MDMLAEVLVNLGLPMLGKAIGMPNLAEQAKGMVRDALGLPKESTEAQIAEAAKNNPEVLKSVEEAAAEKWKYLATKVQTDATETSEINQTIRAGYAAGIGVSPWHWRHLVGYVTTLWIAAPLPFVVAGMWIVVWRGDVTPLNTIIAAMTALASWIAIAAAFNGVIAKDTTVRSHAERTGEMPTSAISAIIKAIAGRK